LARRTVTVNSGTPATLSVAMDGGTSGWLTVKSPVPASILVKGAVVGRTDSPRTSLPAGRHQIVLVNEALNYREERTVDVAAGQIASLELPAATGLININAQPWASVWVDGVAIGDTPIGNYALPIGPHEVILRNPQFGEVRQTVTVGVGAPARLGVDLMRK
jgi:hypothetical protein